MGPNPVSLPRHRVIKVGVDYDGSWSNTGLVVYRKIGISVLWTFRSTITEIPRCPNPMSTESRLGREMSFCSFSGLDLTVG